MKRKSDSVVQVELNPADHSGGTTDTTSSTSPLYGTHQYWENRYQQFFRNPINDQDPPDPIHQQIYCFPVTEENKNSVDDNLQKEMPEPGHAWYFTYDELQPLIMPLILGNDSILDQNDSVEETIINVTTTKDMESNTQDRTFHVLEIGCGDVPLGIDLCKDLQKNTRKGDSIPKYHVLCFDYCETVIQHLIQQHRGNACDWDDAKNSSSFIHLEFKVHDARDLPYEDQFFSLVMDKGTIDAQISDGENGFTDCITMVHEVARLLKYNGNFLIVSHFNAGEPSGIVILNDVILPGLRMLDDSHVSWAIEVHGNCDDDVDLDEVTDGDEVEVEDEDNGEETEEDVAEGDNNSQSGSDKEETNKDFDARCDGDNSSNISLGPAVYIIKKQMASQGTGGDITIEFQSH